MTCATSAPPCWAMRFGPEDEGNPRVWVDAKGEPHTARPSEGSYQNDAACVGGGTLSYGAQAWRYLPQDFRCAPPTERRRVARWKTGHLLRRSGALLRKGRIRDRHLRRLLGTPFHGRASAHCPCRRCRPAVSSHSGAGRPAVGPAPVSPAHGAQQRALQRARPVHALPLVFADLPAKWMPRTARRTP